MITSKAMGQAVVSILQNPEKCSNQYLLVASLVTTQNEILAALEKSTSHKWKIVQTTTEEKLREATERIRKGDFAGFYTMGLVSMYANKEGLGSDYTKEKNFANDLLGLKMEELQDIVDEAVRLKAISSS